MGWADQALLQRGRSLHGEQRIHECLVNAAAKLTESFGEDKVPLRRIALGVSEATGVHDGKIGPQAMADSLIGGPEFMREHLQGAQDADGHGPSTTRGLWGKPCGETLLDGADERRPGKGVSPLTHGMHDGDKISHLQAGSSTAQPRLEVTNKAPRRLSCGKGE
jgi:hypothetical protein